MSDERVAVVTGTTAGIGKEIARGLAAAGLTVVMHGRDAARTEAAAADVRKSGGAVHTAVADLSSRRSVLALAREIGDRFGRVDVLVNNAAVVPSARKVTVDGLEEAFAVNVLAPYLLVRELHPALTAGAPARVLFTYGGGQADLDLDDLQSERSPYDGWRCYVQTKNAGAALMGALSRRHAAERILFVGAIPGIVDTEGMRGIQGSVGWMMFFLRPFQRTPAQGARTAVWVATAPELEGVGGKVFGNVLGSGWKNELQLPANVTDPAVGDRVLATCERLAQ